MFFDRGEGVTQREILTKLECRLELTAVDTADRLNTTYSTYKEWKGDRRVMTGPTVKLINILYRLHNTTLGKEFGV